MIIRYLIGCFFLAANLVAEDSIFKTCLKSDFCNRLRYSNESSGYSVNLHEITTNGRTVTFTLTNSKTFKDLEVNIDAVDNDIFRVRIDEPNPSPRFHLDGVLDGIPQLKDFYQINIGEYINLLSCGGTNITVFTSPFIIEIRKHKKLISVINAEDRLVVGTEEPNVAIALDINFPESERVYGIPEHADHLALRTTTTNGRDPYRLFNLDVAYYQLETTVALYGAVPVVYAHSALQGHTSGIFWHNAAETWVEVDNKANGVNTHFMSESGIIDLFILTGPSPKDVAVQYTSLTGTAPLPQYFTLGHHQSRWNYMSEEDVQTVVAEFDNHDLPLDVIWLDIEYTDKKKYFTWDPVTFPTPLKMSANLTATKRKLVTIIDPHIKKESGYFVYDQALVGDFFVKNADGGVFEGDCWPGLSSYIDFLHPDARDYFASLYAFDIFNGSTENTYIWNDMNEPSVFDDNIEKTFPKDVLHYGNVKNRDVHNVYGFFQTMATYEGLLNRSKNKRRPFVLTRSHFAGTQRYSAIWTGDNTADWAYLASSVPMCLTEALAGISFCGADVGGFFYDPSVELLQRWYQLGAWLPFFRAHAHIDAKRREPYLFPEDIQQRIRTSLRQRYAHLPLWYTLFYQHEFKGEPVIRPLFYVYPEDPYVLDLDTQFIVGNVMVVPVIEPNVTSVNVYFPGGAQKKWFDVNNFHIHHGTGNQSVNVTLDAIPLYYGDGSVITRKDTPRPSSEDTEDDPYTEYIFYDDNNNAKGCLYLDDHESFDYRNGSFIYIQFLYSNDTFRSRVKHPNPEYTPHAKLDRIVLAYPPAGLKIASVTTQSGIKKQLPVTYENNYLEVTNLNLDLTVPFTLKWK